MAKLGFFGIKMAHFLLKGGHFGLKMATDKNVCFKIRNNIEMQVWAGLYHFWFIFYTQATIAPNFPKLSVPK